MKIENVVGERPRFAGESQRARIEALRQKGAVANVQQKTIAKERARFDRAHCFRLAAVEPLLRESCTHELDAGRPLDDVVADLIAIAERVG